MNQYIKHKFIGICLFLGLPYIAGAHSPYQYTLESQVKIKSIKKTAQDALQMYREIGATPQQIAVPYMFLSFLGHPNYPTISQDSNVCILVYKSPVDLHRKYVIMAKLHPDNNLKKIAEGLGWNVEEYKEWSFFTKNKDNLQLIEDKNSLTNYAEKSIQTDIEFITIPSILSLTKLNPDKDLHHVLSNVNQAIFNIDLPENQILVHGSINHKQDKPHLSSWLENHTNCWGLSAKTINQNSKDSNVRISLERKEIPNFINQLRAKVLSIEGT